MGAVAGTSNVIVDVLVGLDKALREGDTETAQKLQKDIDVLRGVLGLGTVPSGHEAGDGACRHRQSGTREKAGSEAYRTRRRQDQRNAEILSFV